MICLFCENAGETNKARQSRGWRRTGWRLLAAMAMLSSAAVRAEPILLSELLATNGTVVAGNSYFDQFQVTPTGEMPAPDSINVIPIQDAAGNFGIRFQGGFLDRPGAGPSTLTISYRATVQDVGEGFSGITLSGNPAAIGQAIVQVRLDISGVNLDHPLLIFDSESEGTLLLDRAVMQPMLGSMDIDLFISSEVSPPASAGFASFIDMTFAQTNIPEPNSLPPISLVAIGTLMLPLRRRKSR